MSWFDLQNIASRNFVYMESWRLQNDTVMYYVHQVGATDKEIIGMGFTTEEAIAQAYNSFLT